tara:strand:- start:1544 stop:2395 length:852 start_codon:yes stop_codon:yes gene_type:complete
MIGYNRLGSNGRLGNQMFQYAALRGIAANRNFEWKIPPPSYNHNSNYGLFDCFEMSSVSSDNLGFVPYSDIEEGTHAFDEQIYNNCSDNSNLLGFFQTEKYFKNIENDIRKDFAFISDYLNPCKEIIEQFEIKPIFLHIRRGDAVGREEYHPIHPLSYYEESLKEFDDNIPVFVFTDDLVWCKNQKLFESDKFIFNDNLEKFSYSTIDGLGKNQNSLIPYVDLCLMTLCSGAIIANSSLSWWGSWLQENKNKKIISPMPWFGPSLSHLDTNDIVPESWMVKIL